MHTIELYIRSEEELFNRFDRTHSTLSGDVLSYIKSGYSRKNLGDEAVICICSDTPVDEAKVIAAFRRQLQAERDGNLRQQRINRLQMLRLFVIGLAFVAAGILLSLKINSIADEVISIIGSMAIKDAATIWIEHNPELRRKGRMLDRMLETKIQFEVLP